MLLFFFFFALLFGYYLPQNMPHLSRAKIYQRVSFSNLHESYLTTYHTGTGHQ